MGENEAQRGGESVPLVRWGKDHWSTLAYVAACVAKHRGYLRLEKMRCNPLLHHRLVPRGTSLAASSAYAPTHLAGGRTIEKHDDWSCVEDMIAAGLVTMSEEGNATAGKSPRFALTAAGRLLAHALAVHRTCGGQFETFVPAPELLPRDSAS